MSLSASSTKPRISNITNAQASRPLLFPLSYRRKAVGPGSRFLTALPNPLYKDINLVPGDTFHQVTEAYRKEVHYVKLQPLPRYPRRRLRGFSRLLLAIFFERERCAFSV